MQRLIAHAYADVPYYGRLFRAHGLTPDDVRTTADLARVPITTRATLQALPVADRVARGVNPSHLDAATTAGSSGRPLTIRRHWTEERLLATIRVRAMRDFGLRPHDHVGLVVTSSRKDSTDASIVRRVLETVRTERWHVIDCAAPPAAIVAGLRDHGVAAVAGYPGVLAAVARGVDAGALRALGLRFIATGGEELTARQRTEIATGFGVPVYDSYGSREFDLLAHECPRGGDYHVADDGLVLEVLHDGRPVASGERGEVVGTSLHAYAMPFIRYAQGDVVTQGTPACPCGRPFATIRAIAGRTIDAFPLPGGRVIHPYAVFTPIRERAPWIRQLQVTQTRTDHVVMRIVPAPAPDADALALVRAMAEAALGPAVRFDLEIVAEIANEPSGKFRTYRSLVRSDYED